MITTIKVGSGILDGGGDINYSVLRGVARVISELREEKFIVVSSGALLMGLLKIGLNFVPKNIKKRQAICAIGQPELIRKWNEVFSEYNLLASQVLITHEDIGLPKRAKNIEDTIFQIFDIGAVPIINENDTVSTEEIRFGDNDFLSAYVSVLVGAKRLIIITDIDGVLDNEGNLIKEVSPDNINNVLGKIGKTQIKKRVSSGGIVSKLTASKIASEFGVECFIINGRKIGCLRKIFDGENPGTKVLPMKKYTRRETWMLNVMKGKGRIFIDKGAYDAVKNGKSLLPAGIKDVSGNFSVGDIVEVYFEDEILGKGITNYSSQEITLIKGKRTDQIEKILPYKRADEVIHRDNFVEIE